MGRVPLVRLLLPHIAGPDLRRIPRPQLVADLRQQIHQPVTVARASMMIGDGPGRSR